MFNVPKNREEAIQALVEFDVQRWGEEERAASLRQHQGLSYGRALNSLAGKIEFGLGQDATEIRKAANQHLTDDDKTWLRSGG